MYAMSPSSWPADPVAQDADPIRFHLNHVTGRQPAIELDTRAACRCARSEDFARIQRLRLAGVGDQVLNLVVHAGGGVASPRLAVDAYGQSEVADIRLVRGHYARAEHIGPIPILGLGGTHPDRQLLGLNIARRHVV